MANSAGLEERWGNNLNHRSIGQNLQHLLRDVDQDNILIAMDNEDDFALWVLLDELLTNSRECQLLSIQHDLHAVTRGWVSQGSGWEEEPGKAHETNVPQDNLPGWGPDLCSDHLGDTVSTGLSNGHPLSSREGLLTFDVAKEKGLRDAVQKIHDVGVGPGVWCVDSKVYLVTGSSLKATSSAKWA